MSNHQPGIYHDIGKKATDLLYKDYSEQPPLHYRYRWFNWSLDFACQINNILPGLGTALRFIIPYKNKVELRYLQDYAGVTADISLGESPLLNISGVLGSGLFSIGTDISFDTKSYTFPKYNAGLTFNTPFIVASVTLNDKGDTVRGTCYFQISHLTKTAIAVEVEHDLVRRENSYAFGTQLDIIPHTLMKARASSNGRLGALFQHDIYSSLYVTIAGDVDVWDVTRGAKIGMSMAIRPRRSIRGN